MNWPANSSSTMAPGSLIPMARLVRVVSGTAIAAVASPDAKSPTAAAMLAAWGVFRARTETTAIASATREPAVPGANGERPAPNPVERKVESGRSRKARRRASARDAAGVDFASDAEEDRGVLIGVGARVYNRATRA